jgi:outer membrane murein-binding lipoprotein Lpp
LAALEIRWENVQRISPKDTAVVTGESSDEGEAKAAPKLQASKPICVYVCDNTDSDEQQKLETLVFKGEKVALAMKAFRTVRMDSTQVASDPLLADQGKESPRLLLVNPDDSKVTVLEKSKLSGSAVFNALENVSDKFYVQKLEKTVKAHLDLLTEQDQLANKEKKLNEDQARAAEEKDAKAKKELDEIKDELKAVRDELKELSKKQAELWKFTPKSKADAS